MSCSSGSLLFPPSPRAFDGPGLWKASYGWTPNMPFGIPLEKPWHMAGGRGRSGNAPIASMCIYPFQEPNRGELDINFAPISGGIASPRLSPPSFSEPLLLDIAMSLTSNCTAAVPGLVDVDAKSVCVPRPGPCSSSPSAPRPRRGFSRCRRASKKCEPPSQRQYNGTLTLQMRWWGHSGKRHQ
jgi:hypothetical protein